jgi:hypothetical protein
MLSPHGWNSSGGYNSTRVYNSEINAVSACLKKSEKHGKIARAIIASIKLRMAPMNLWRHDCAEHIEVDMIRHMLALEKRVYLSAGMENGRENIKLCTDICSHMVHV